jgi:amino acid adenylation domain-containing protein
MNALRSGGSFGAENRLLAAFVARVGSEPATPAIRANGITVTYAQFAAAVAGCVAALDRASVDANDIVALGAESTVQTLAWMIAIVASGAAYLPLDPTQANARLAAMVADARPHLLVTDRALRARLPRTHAWLDSEAPLPSIDSLTTRGSGTLAYVLFTSGSTGRAKGVAMRTTAVAALLDWHCQHRRLGKPARTLQFAPLGFDVSFQEIFSTLATGGTLVLPTESERRDPWGLLALLERERVERLFLPYVALQALAEAAIFESRSVPAALIDVIAAGEQLRITPAIRTFFSALPACVLHNHYGPTETHVVTTHELSGPVAQWPELPPIGLPLPHVRAWLAYLEGGDDGELLLGGDCLAAGYVRPEVHAQRFVELDGQRWYRTGDRLRRNAAGEFEYLGRLDDQIKIDGHRVEPGEIEAVMCRHDRVAEAVVVPVARAGAIRLVAHIVPRLLCDDDAGLSAALDRHCARALPRYMQPQAFVFHPALPTTSSGKIDRHALAEAPNRVASVWNEHSPLQAQLLGLWQRILDVPLLPATINLFEFGARSLDVVHVLTELRRHGHVLSVAQVYENPTIAAQVALLQGRPASHSVADANPLRGFREREALARFASGPR